MSSDKEAARAVLAHLRAIGAAVVDVLARDEEPAPMTITQARVFLWEHPDGKARGADVVCAACQLKASVVVDYARCEQRAVDLRRDGLEERERVIVGDEYHPRDYWKRFQRVRCTLCFAIVAEEEIDT